jgi:hypothetical protein
MLWAKRSALKKMKMELMVCVTYGLFFWEFPYA